MKKERKPLKGSEGKQLDGRLLDIQERIKRVAGRLCVGVWANSLMEGCWL